MYAQHFELRDTQRPYELRTLYRLLDLATGNKYAHSYGRDNDYVSLPRNVSFPHPMAHHDQTRSSRLGYLNGLKVLLSVFGPLMTSGVHLLYLPYTSFQNKIDGSLPKFWTEPQPQVW